MGNVGHQSIHCVYKSSGVPDLRALPVVSPSPLYRSISHVDREHEYCNTQGQVSWLLAQH